MKLKNIMKDVRQLREGGQIILVQPGETVEVKSAVYDDRVFQEVNTKKRNEELEKPINKKEVETDDTSK